MKGEMVNHDATFKEACERATAELQGKPGYRWPVAMTSRQYRKWKRGRGTAYKFGRAKGGGA